MSLGPDDADTAGPGSVLVVIPALNEADTLAAVIAEIDRTVPGIQVLVVDDGSSDATAQVALDSGAALLKLPFNLGVGGAMRAGYKFARRRGYSTVVQVDADGQHDAREIPRLVSPLASGDVDIMIGSRFAGPADYVVSGPRKWAMRFLAVVLSRVAGSPLTDTTSGFKACGPRAVALFAVEYPAEYLGDTIESLVIASRAGLRVRETQVSMRQRAGGTPSHGPLRSAIFLGRAVLALTIALTRPQDRSLKEESS